jgi:hypothetical protein
MNANGTRKKTAVTTMATPPTSAPRRLPIRTSPLG